MIHNDQLRNSASFQYSVGMDVSKEYVDIFMLPSEQHIRIKNKADHITRFIQNLSLEKEKTIFVCEATGGYERLLIKLLQSHKYCAECIHVNEVKSFIRAQGQLAKTDAIDAKGLAHFALFPNRKKRNKTPISLSSEEIKSLWRRRQQLNQILHAEKRRLEITINESTRKSIELMIIFLEESIVSIESKIEATIQNSDELAHKAEILLSVKGVGKQAVTTILGGLPELGAVTNKQAAALVGVAPYAKQSGKTNYNSHIFGGRGRIRTQIYMNTIVCIRYNKQIKNYFNELCQRGKPKKVAVIACANKLVRILNSMLRNKTPWQDVSA